MKTILKTILITLIINFGIQSNSSAWIVSWCVMQASGCQWVSAFGHGPCCTDAVNHTGCIKAKDANGVEYPNQFCNEGLLMQNSGALPIAITLSANGRLVVGNQIIEGINSFITYDDNKSEVYLETDDGESFLIKDLHDLQYDHMIQAKLLNDGRIEIEVDSLGNRSFTINTENGRVEESNRKIFEYRVSDYLNKTLNIFPNPASDKIKVEFSISPSSTKRIISIYSIDGKILFEKTLNKNFDDIDISNFENGLYCVKVVDEISGQLIGTKRFLKE